MKEEEDEDEADRAGFLVRVLCQANWTATLAALAADRSGVPDIIPPPVISEVPLFRFTAHHGHHH